VNGTRLQSMMRLREGVLGSSPLTALLWTGALVCGVLPLWVGGALPLVDLPQHLHLISVLHRLDDASTLYPEVFARRPEMTPYLGYYYAVSWLAHILPLELANRLFLSAYVAGLPLSLAFLVRSFARPTWPALLAVPFAYGDSFAWGFINYCASLPLAILCVGLFVRAIEDADQRMRWSRWLALCLVLVLLFHVQSFAFLAFALPLMLLTTPAPEGRGLGPRFYALVGVLPAVLLFASWVVVRLGKPTEIAPGEPWKAWGPMFSAQNLSNKSFAQNLADLVTWSGPGDGNLLEAISFPVLGGITRDGADKYAVLLAFVLALAALVLGLFRGAAYVEGPVARLRMPLLAALAFALFFLLPFDIRGYMYYLNTRYAHLAAALLVCSVPPLRVGLTRVVLVPAALVSVLVMQPLYEAFAEFAAESRALTRLAEQAADKPRVMGLLYNVGSANVRYPVHIHAACSIARDKGGLTNFSFASTPHSPLMYQHGTPPTFPSEWRPSEMRWTTQGSHYDHFLLRGRTPEQAFGRLMETELYEAGFADGFFLVRRRSGRGDAGTR
jgi:hypothetical protein